MKRNAPVRASGFARHVSGDGCQLVIESGMLEKGQDLAFALNGFGLVSGTVRWVVDDRAGFVFDEVIGDDKQQALARQGRARNGVEIYGRP